jgi:Rod binding domain-containing protein
MTIPTSASDVLGAGDVQIPVGVNATTPEQKETYKAAAEFERFFVSYMMKQMNSATDSLTAGDDDDGNSAVSTGGTDQYKDMIQDQMTQAILDGGGLGIAAIIYNQVQDQQKGSAS